MWQSPYFDTNLNCAHCWIEFCGECNWKSLEAPISMVVMNDDLVEILFCPNSSPQWDLSITLLPHDWHASKWVPQGIGFLPLMQALRGTTNQQETIYTQWNSPDKPFIKCPFLSFYTWDPLLINLIRSETRLPLIWHLSKFYTVIHIIHRFNLTQQNCMM